MRLTLYEIETITRKASIGAGLPDGLGEDIGDAATWLAGQNRDGVEAALRSIRTGMSKTKVSVADNAIMIFTDAHVAVCGPSVIDLLIGEKTCTEIHLRNPDSVVLLFGLAGVASGRHGCAFNFDFTNGARVLVSSDKVSENGEVRETGCNVIVSCRWDEQEISIAAIPKDGVEVSDDIWHEMTALAAKTYVPESSASRAAGAGAGLTDND